MRQQPKQRKADILAAAVKHARRFGYTTLTRSDVAHAAGCSDALVSVYWGTMPQLKRAVMRAAIVERDLFVIAQGLAVRDAQALKAPEDIRKAAAAKLAG